MDACLIVEDHPLTLDGTTLALQSAYPGLAVFQAESLADAIAVLERQSEIGLVLLDLDLGDSQGIATLSALTGWCADHDRNVRVVVLSAHAEPDLVRAVIEHYGSGFILKATSREIFRQAIALTLAGGIFIPEVVLRRLAPAPLQPAAPPPSLTRREMAVARLLVRGFTYKRIARALEAEDGRPISEHTVRAHVGNIAWKLRVTENAKAGVIAEIERAEREMTCAPTLRERSEALAFLVHFVGDVHQPMHTLAEGRGGNAISVVAAFRGQAGELLDKLTTTTK